MPVHVEELSSEVTVMDGEMPLSPAQVDRLVKLVIARLDERKKSASQRREATEMRPDSTSPVSGGCHCE
jgi:hypothetical protein